MYKIKLHLSLVISILFVFVTGLLLISFDSAGWIKIPICLVLFSVALFLIISRVNRENKIIKEDFDDLNDNLKEKRIRIKTDEKHIGISGIPDMELKKEILNLSGHISLNLQNTDNQKISEVISYYKNVADSHGSKDIKKEIDKIHANQKVIALNTNKAFTIADNLSSSAKNAFDLSGDVQEAIKIVTAVLHESANRSNRLFEQSKKISKIIEIISEIANKTHVLSINASIVSARAGKDGKAFEVVSKEIRKLANETDLSLSEIEDEVLKIQEIIRGVVAGINDANEQSLKENELLSEVIGALQGVTLGVEVMRAVSNVANSKTLQQNELIDVVIKCYESMKNDLLESVHPEEDLLSSLNMQNKVAAIDKRISEIISSYFPNEKM